MPASIPVQEEDDEFIPEEARLVSEMAKYPWPRLVELDQFCGNGGCGHDTAHCTCPDLT